MKAQALRSLALAVAFAVAATARAQEANRNLIAAGHDFALQTCSACHAVEKEQKSAPLLNPPAPSFLVIAQRDDLSEDTLQKFLVSLPHKRDVKMPNWLIAESHIKEIVAYLLSLKDGH